MGKLKAFLKKSADKAPAAVASSVASEKKAKKAPEKGRLSRVLAKAAAQGNPTAYTDVNRIVGLPVVDGWPQEERDAVQRELVQSAYYDDPKEPFRLHDLQCDAFLAYREYGVLFGPIGVGWGKTLITLLCAGEAYKKGIQRTLLVIPSNLMAQLTLMSIPWARQRVVLNGCPFIPVTGTPARRRSLARSNRRGCYIMASSVLSAKTAEEDLLSINPGLVIVDEAHHFRNIGKSARAKRLMRFINSRGPEVIWLSGTITSKSVMDYLHLVLPMGDLSPLPLKKSVALDWAAVLDSEASPNETQTGPVKPLLEWASRQPKVPHCPMNSAGFRRAYMHRLKTNPAVVGTGDKVLGVSLNIVHTSVEIEGSEGGDRLKDLRDAVEEDWQAPNGDNIDFAFHKYRWLYELSSGIYNDAFWPEAEDLAKRRKIPLSEAKHLLDKAEEHHEELQALAKIIRNWLSRHEIPGLDSPMLLGHDMYQHGARNVGHEMFECWSTARAMREATPNMPERDTRVVRVCDYKIQFAKKWAKEHGHGVIWYFNRGVGAWLHEQIPEALYCPAGPQYDALLADLKNTTGRLVIASIRAHSTGKDMYNQQNQCFVQWPREAAIAEQVLGRLHRFGQQADELDAEILVEKQDSGNNAPTFDEMLYAAMLRDSLYIHQTLGSWQKPITANYPVTPKVFPADVLEERSFRLENKLSEDQEKSLAEMFRKST